MAFSVELSAQTPINDVCESAIALGTIPACPTTIYSNINATETNIGSNNNPFCAEDGINDNDVWFSFKTSANIFDYQISVKGSGSPQLLFPNVTIFRGECGIGNLGKLCADTLFSNSSEMTLATFGLTPNEIYYIRISGVLAGQFKVCVTEYQLLTIKNGSSTACNGVLFDSGGPNGDYKNGENFTYTICPDEAHKCIKFSFEKYEIEATDKITFFNGSTTTAPIIRQINGEDFNSAFNTGAVSFDVYASSNCMTIQFISSNDTKTYPGFIGKWQCAPDECPNFQSINFETNIKDSIIEKVIARPFTNTKLLNIKCGSGGNNYGIFNAALDETELGIEQGLVLSSGDIFKINNEASVNASTRIAIPGDEDLDKLSTEPSRDACAVEFEVYATTDEIKFDYIFGSEEYPDFIAQPEFNDIFALMIEGQGITPDAPIAPKKNLAKLPNGTQISITEVNHSSNFDYYFNNYDGKKIAYNGLIKGKGGKTPMIARTTVIPCQTYKLKMAIADRGDDYFDSGVFIGNIRSSAPEIILTSALNLENLVERCSGNNEQISIVFEFPTTQNYTFQVNISGTAINGLDYNTTLPNVINVPKGTKELNFPISVINDAIFDDNESLIITLSSDYGCGIKPVSSKTIFIKENINVAINAADTVLVCNLSESKGISLKASGATTYFWSNPSAFSNPTGIKTNFKPSQEGWYKVVGNTNNCKAEDSIYAKLITPSLKVKALSATEICEGKTVTLTAENNFDNKGLLWSPDWMKFDNNKAQTVTMKPNSEGFAEVKASIGGCDLIDSILIKVNRIDMPALAADTTICYKHKMQLAAVTFAPNTQFTWTPSGPSDPSENDVIIQPTSDVTYILKGQTPICVAYDTVKIKVDGKLEIIGKDTLRVCKGAKILLNAEIQSNTLPKDVNFKWESKIALFDDANSLVTNASPVQKGWIYAKTSTSKCELKDSIFVIVDSLPSNLDIMVFPQKPFYCEGDTILIYSNASMPKNLYPDATFIWQSPTLGAISPTDKANLKILANATNDYIRVIKNGVCENRDTAKIIVLPILPTIKIDDVSICVQQEVTLEIKNPSDYEKFMWKPSDGLSCADCSNPKTNKQGQFVVTAEKTGYCPISKEVKVTVINPILEISANKLVFCSGEKIETQINVIGNINNITWQPIDGLSCTNCFNPIATKLGTFKASSNILGCPIEKSITIRQIDEKITLSSNNFTICDEDKVTIKILNFDKLKDFVINPTASIINGNIEFINAGNYTLFAKTIDNECPVNERIEVKKGISPNINITASPTIFTYNQNPITLKVTGTNLRDGTTIWSNGSGENPIEIILNTAKDTFFVIGQSNDGCIAKTGITLYRFGVPSIFSPSIDTFKLVNLPKAASFKEVKIFNRWGNTVYQSSEKLEWNGKQNNDGEELPTDVYIYVITLIDNSTKATIVIKGDVTLVR